MWGYREDGWSGHSECGGPTTEDCLASWHDQRRGGWRKEMSHRHRTYLGGARGAW